MFNYYFGALGSLEEGLINYIFWKTEMFHFFLSVAQN